MKHPERLTMPTALVLLGATGDLARKKLLRAIADLAERDLLPEHFHIIAFSRDALSDEAYRNFARTHITASGKNYTPAILERLLQSMEYVQGTFEDRSGFGRIKSALEAYDASIGMCTSKLFYLAVPPTFYDTIFEQIAHTKLDSPCMSGDGWVRILVEKPFGKDLNHAHYLEDKLSVLFREEQIYRIDHYLAKDALQNIIAFRFSNGIFEDNWNRDYVEAVTIRAYEGFDVSERGAFFDGVGALRDVGQNHMLQMLALIAMENPRTLESESIRTTRANVLSSLLHPDLARGVVRGQYEGYRTTNHVAPASDTETYVALKTELNTPAWKGVPFYLEHGKALHETRTDITVRFRASRCCVCGIREPHDHPNFVRFSISPEQKITVRFWVRAPGLSYTLEPNDLVFDRHATLRDGATLTEAYEEVLFDALRGDQTLFVSNAEQVAAWHFITAILEGWQSHPLLPYARGSQGPAHALRDEMESILQLSY